MSWKVGWYGYDANSEDHCAWGPNDTADGARQHPYLDLDFLAEKAMDIVVFHIDETEPTP